MKRGGLHGNRLSELPAGTRVRLVRVGGGHAVHARLAGLGLVAGVEIDVRRNDGRGPVVLAHRHARIALGRGVAEHVLVEEASDARGGGGLDGSGGARP